MAERKVYAMAAKRAVDSDAHWAVWRASTWAGRTAAMKVFQKADGWASQTVC